MNGQFFIQESAFLSKPCLLEFMKAWIFQELTANHPKSSNSGCPGLQMSHFGAISAEVVRLSLFSPKIPLKSLKKVRFITFVPFRSNHILVPFNLVDCPNNNTKCITSALALSARYLSDLLKQETGKTALDHIHIALVNEAKNILMSTDNTVAETAYQLGFENPPYFSRLFKKEIGLTPTEYREQFLN